LNDKDVSGSGKYGAVVNSDGTRDVSKCGKSVYYMRNNERPKESGGTRYSE
jgi:predicted lipoprotein with Yx(FWY)xxD motif